MKPKSRTTLTCAWVLTCIVLGAGLSTPAGAHHSFAMFDRKQLITLKGAVVTRIEWANPHAYLFVEAPDSEGTAKLYAIECSSPNELSNWGWKKNTIKVGDPVTVAMYPLRDGRQGGLIFWVTLQNGVVLKGN